MSRPALHAPTVVRDLLARHGLRPDKAFGQNFLVDGHTLADIVAAAAPGPGDTGLEIGPGLGTLTRALATRAERVISVELDARLLPALSETLADLTNVTVVQGDGLEFDFHRLPAGSLFVANLPYNVGTPILVRALEALRFRRLVVLVQREVAERLCAAPGQSAYGALSVVVAYYGQARRIRDVKPAAFYPVPEVTSSIVCINTHPDVTPDAGLLEFVHLAFRHRRKTLSKSLSLSGLERVRVDAALAELGLDPRIRAERLGLERFIALFQYLQEG